MRSAIRKRRQAWQVVELSLASLRRNVDLWTDRYAPLLSGASGDTYGLDLPFEGNPGGELNSIADIIESLQEAIRSRDVRSMPHLFNELFRATDPLGVEIRYREWQALYQATTLLARHELSFREAHAVSLYVPRQVFRGRESLVRSIRRSPGKLFRLDARAFEEMIAFIFQANGFEVELTPKAKDDGRDIVAVQRSLGVLTRWLLECKRYAAAHKVGVELVRQLYGVLMSERANKAILVTTSSFTAGAREFASRHPWSLTLQDGPGVLEWANATAV